MNHDYIEHAVLDCYRFLGTATLMPARVRFWQGAVDQANQLYVHSCGVKRI
jgi:hypothetical protein